MFGKRKGIKFKVKNPAGNYFQTEAYPCAQGCGASLFGLGGSKLKAVANLESQRTQHRGRCPVNMLPSHIIVCGQCGIQTEHYGDTQAEAKEKALDWGRFHVCAVITSIDEPEPKFTASEIIARFTR